MDLTDNNIGEQAAFEFLKLLRNNPRFPLKRLDLEENVVPIKYRKKIDAELAINIAKSDPKQLPTLKKQVEANRVLQAPMKEHVETYGTLSHFKKLEKQWQNEIEADKEDWFQVH